MGFWNLAPLAFPSTRASSLSPAMASPNGFHSPPDETLMCFDSMYFVASRYDSEWTYEWSPAWRFVGTHMRWAKELQDLADTYLRGGFGVAPDEPVPDVRPVVLCTYFN